jgi:hypothetical protein
MLPGTTAETLRVLYYSNRVNADHQFTAIFFRMNTGWSVISSLRKIAFIGMAHAPTLLNEEHRRTLDYLVSEGRLQKMVVGIADAADLEKTADLLGTSLTGRVIQNAAGSVDAASLVFAHTILDDSLSSFVEMTTELAPAFWQKRVAKKTFELADLVEHTREDLVGAAIKNEIWGVKRNESLLKKATLLHEVCRLTPKARSPAYQFDEDILRKIDKARQDIVHGDLLGKEIPDIEGKLQYLQNTGYYFFFMMNEAFGLRLDSEAISHIAKGL